MIPCNQTVRYCSIDWEDRHVRTKVRELAELMDSGYKESFANQQLHRVRIFDRKTLIANNFGRGTGSH